MLINLGSDCSPQQWADSGCILEERETVPLPDSGPRNPLSYTTVELIREPPMALGLGKAVMGNKLRRLAYGLVWEACMSDHAYRFRACVGSSDQCRKLSGPVLCGHTLLGCVWPIATE